MSLAPEQTVTTFGRVSLSKDNYWQIDALPFVMARIRSLFPKAFGGGQGKQTHRTVKLPPSPNTAKDVLWFMERYPLDCEPKVNSRLRELAEQYDRAIAAAARGDKNYSFDLSPLALTMGEPPRDHQVGFRNLVLDVRRTLLADDIGLGKTISGIALLPEAERRPAVIVVPSHLPKQWEKQVKRFLPGASTRFIKGDSRVFICSLRSGAGLDGLQEVCSTVVIGELDWSPQVMDQVIGRLDREGQPNQVKTYFPTIDDGADPFMLEVLGDKQSQSDGLVDGVTGRADILEDSVRTDRIREMAEAYLISIGEAPPSREPTKGLHAEVVAALRRISLPSNSEREMQDALWSVLPGMLPHAKVEREVRIGERGRLDFLVTTDQERIAIECKIDQTGRPAVYRQVRRYAEEADITGAVILAPWSGVHSFVIDEVPVSIVDWAKQSLKRGSA